MQESVGNLSVAEKSPKLEGLRSRFPDFSSAGLMSILPTALSFLPTLEALRCANLAVENPARKLEKRL